MSDEAGVLGVVVGHGAMAQGLLDAVRRIAGGQADALLSLSNDGKGPAQLREELDDLVADARAVVFVDLQTGSCGAAALSCCRDRDTRAVVCGVNLPMLLDFVFNRQLPLAELVPRVVEKGRASIGTVPPPV